VLALLHSPPTIPVACESGLSVDDIKDSNRLHMEGAVSVVPTHAQNKQQTCDTARWGSEWDGGTRLTQAKLVHAITRA
jgi:hypothetical protein